VAESRHILAIELTDKEMLKALSVDDLTRRTQDDLINIRSSSANMMDYQNAKSLNGNNGAAPSCAMEDLVIDGTA
jgi:hypothetical protein